MAGKGLLVEGGVSGRFFQVGETVTGSPFFCSSRLSVGVDTHFCAQQLLRAFNKKMTIFPANAVSAKRRAGRERQAHRVFFPRAVIWTGKAPKERTALKLRAKRLRLAGSRCTLTLHTDRVIWKYAPHRGNRFARRRPPL